MDATALLLSRLQFAFTISFHIIFPSFTIGLAAWLTVLEALHLATGRPAYRVGLRVLAQDLRHRIRPRRGLRNRDGVPVRHQLERAVADVGTDPGAAAVLRDLHGLHARGQFLRHPAFRPASRSTVVLSVLDRDGGARHDAFGVLDHGQQQLDAGAGRLRDPERRLRRRPTGPRSSSVRLSGCAFRTCCLPLI